MHSLLVISAAGNMNLCDGQVQRDRAYCLIYPYFPPLNEAKNFQKLENKILTSKQGVKHLFACRNTQYSGNKQVNRLLLSCIQKKE